MGLLGLCLMWEVIHVPVEEVFNHVSPQMEVTFRPQSMTVLRLKLKNTHRQ